MRLTRDDKEARRASLLRRLETEVHPITRARLEREIRDLSADLDDAPDPGDRAARE